jgi:hypothetical protein
MPARSSIGPEREEWLAEFRTRWERDRRALAEAQAAVGLFNAHMVGRRTALFWPTIAAALIGKHPWVRIVCQSCDTITELDLRMKRRDPDASIRVVLRDVQCPRCNGRGRPRIVGLAKYAT